MPLFIIIKDCLEKQKIMSKSMTFFFENFTFENSSCVGIHCITCRQLSIRGFQAFQTTQISTFLLDRSIDIYSGLQQFVLEDKQKMQLYYIYFFYIYSYLGTDYIADFIREKVVVVNASKYFVMLFFNSSQATKLMWRRRKS